MSKCAAIDSFVTPYVDGELSEAECRIVEQHVGVCPPCRARVSAERAVREALARRRPGLCAERASDALRARLIALNARGQARSDAGTQVRPTAPVHPSTWRARVAPLSLAAALVLVVAAAFLYQLTASSSRVMAAELAADHVKCFALNSVLGTHQTPEIVESSMASGFDWPIQLPRSDRAGLDLVGARPCLYGEGRVAHIMFRHHGTPVSLFMLPKTTRADALVRVLGHEAAIWSVGDRTFVLIARETQSEVARIAASVQSSVK